MQIKGIMKPLEKLDIHRGSGGMFMVIEMQAENRGDDWRDKVGENGA